MYLGTGFFVPGVYLNYIHDGCVGLKGGENWKDGDPGGTRTPNPLVRSQMLYPVELRGRFSTLPLTDAIKPHTGDSTHVQAYWCGVDWLDDSINKAGSSESMRVVRIPSWSQRAMLSRIALLPVPAG